MAVGVERTMTTANDEATRLRSAICNIAQAIQTVPLVQSYVADNKSPLFQSVSGRLVPFFQKAAPAVNSVVDRLDVGIDATYRFLGGWIAVTQDLKDNAIGTTRKIGSDVRQTAGDVHATVVAAWARSSESIRMQRAEIVNRLHEKKAAAFHRLPVSRPLAAAADTAFQFVTLLVDGSWNAVTLLVGSLSQIPSVIREWIAGTWDTFTTNVKRGSDKAIQRLGGATHRNGLHVMMDWLPGMYSSITTFFGDVTTLPTLILAFRTTVDRLVGRSTDKTKAD